jgi:hypothetical protein
MIVVFAAGGAFLWTELPRICDFPSPRMMGRVVSPVWSLPMMGGDWAERHMPSLRYCRMRKRPRDNLFNLLAQFASVPDFHLFCVAPLTGWRYFGKISLILFLTTRWKDETR